MCFLHILGRCRSRAQRGNEMTEDRELLDFDARHLDDKIAWVIRQATWDALLRCQDDEEEEKDVEVER